MSDNWEVPTPWRVEPIGGTGAIIAANGNQVCHTSWEDTDLSVLRMIVALVNAASGPTIKVTPGDYLEVREAAKIPNLEWIATDELPGGVARILIKKRDG